MKGNKKIMQKIGKIIAIIYTFLFLLLIASSLYDAIKRDRFEGAIITIVIFSVPYFFYLWVKSFKASLRNYLERFARYDSKPLEVMSLSELQKRRKLYRLNKDVDHRETTREQLNIKIKEEVDFQKSQPTAIGQFMDGFNEAQKGSKGFFGTHGKRIVCKNCGVRMMKHFGMWTDSAICQQKGIKCVPYEVPDL